MSKRFPIIQISLNKKFNNVIDLLTFVNFQAENK